MTWGADWLTTVVVVTAKSSLLLAAAAAIAFAGRRHAAAVRAGVWALAFVGLLALPLVEPLVPQVSVVRPWPAVETVSSTSGAALSRDARVEPLGRLTPPATPDRARAALDREDDTSPPAPGSPSASAGSSPFGLVSSWLPSTIPVIWLAGVVLVLMRYAAGRVLLAGVRGRSRTVEHGPAVDELESLSARLRLDVPIEVRYGSEETMPSTWGVARPVILLPSTIDRWPVLQRRAVIAHEVAHVSRRDALIQVVAQLACALYWFNPLTWHAARRLRIEREHACDDFVVRRLGSGRDYASHLVEIARSYRPLSPGWAGVSMARPSELEGRLLAILDTARPRTEASPPLVVTSWIATALVVLSLGAATVTTSETSPAPADEAELASLMGRPDMPAGLDLVPANVRSTMPTGRVDRDEAARPRPLPRPDPEPTPSPELEPQSSLAGVATVTPLTAAAPPVARQQDGAQAAGAARPQTGVVGTLVTALGDEDAGVRAQAAQVLGNLGSRDAVPGLVARLSDPSIDVRRAAAFALGEIGDGQASDGLARALGDTAPDVRLAAMTALIELNDPRIVDPLIAALEDAQADVRQRAVYGLGDLGDPRAVPGLIGALDDEDGDVREAAVSALGNLDARDAVPALIERVGDADPDVRERAVGVLSDLSARESIPALIRALDDEDADVRERAAGAVGDLGATEAAGRLRGLVTSDPDMDVRERAASELGDLGDRESVPALIGALGAEDADVREAAASSLADLADRRAVPALIAALSDADGDVRERAAYALGDIGDPSAVESVQALMSDPDADVRMAALSALSDLTRRPDR